MRDSACRWCIGPPLYYLCISNYLCPYLCGYSKGFSSQEALLSLIENWKKVLNKKGFGEAVLMDLFNRPSIQ